MTQEEAAIAIRNKGANMRLLIGSNEHLLLEWGSLVPGAPGPIYCSGPGSPITQYAILTKAKSVQKTLEEFDGAFPNINTSVRVRWGTDVQNVEPAAATDPLPVLCTICQGREYYV